jgi:autotransporter-associated beta strand protein
MTDDGTGRGTFKIESVTITSPGFGYTSPPSITFLKGGAGATAATGTVSLAQNTSGGLTKIGAGTLTLNAVNTYTGATTVSGGTLALGNPYALSPASAVALAGGVLNLNGYTVTNAISGTGQITNGVVETVLSPGGEGTLGTNTLILANATLSGTYLADVTASGACDLVAIQGDIDLSKLALQIVDTGALDIHACYTLLTCSGTRTGAFKSTNLTDSRWHLVYRGDGQVQLLFVKGTVVLLH